MFVGRYSSVGIAIRYGLDCPGIESRWGRHFPHLSRPGLRPSSLLYNGYRVFHRGDKAVGAWRWPPTPSSAEVKERVQLYLYSTSGTSWRVIGWTLPLPITLIYRVFIYRGTAPDRNRHLSWDIWIRSTISQLISVIFNKTAVFNTFAASYLNTQRLNNSCLKSPASTLVDLTFQSRALRSFNLNQLRNLSL